MGDLDDQLRRLADRRAERTPTTGAAAAVASPSTRHGNPGWWGAAAAMLAVLAGAGVWLINADNEASSDIATTTTTTTSPLAGDIKSQTLLALEYGVAVDAPVDWDEIEPARTWGAPTGFVAVDVAPSGPVVEAAEQVALDAVEILGTNPLVEDLVVAGQPAVRLTGEEVVTADLGSFVYAVTIIETPSPLIVDDETWVNIAVASDAAHHDEIVASLRWRHVDSISFPVVGASYDAAAAGPDGIDLRRAVSHEVDHIDVEGLTGAHIAFVLPGPIVVYLSSLSGLPDARIMMLDDSTSTVLASGQVRLLDAAIVDGVPTALVSRQAGPPLGTKEEQLILLDLVSLEEIELRSLGGSGSSLVDARLGEGAIALSLTAVNTTWTEVIDYSGELMWSTAGEFDDQNQLAIDRENVYSIEASTPGGRRPYVRWRIFDVRSGEFIGTFGRAFTVEDGDAWGDVRCSRPEWGSTLWCNAGASDAPTQIDLTIGLVEPVDGNLHGLITRTRELSAAPPDAHPCGRANASYPHEIWPKGRIDAAGESLEIVLSIVDDALIVQGSTADWFTERLSLANPSLLTVEQIDEIELGGLDDSGGQFVLFVPGEGGMTFEFDGCELAFVNGFDI